MSVSARSRLAAGMFAAAAGIALVAPVAVPPAAVPTLTAIASPAIQLSAALTPLAPLTPLAQPVRTAASTAAAVGETPGDWIINAYFTVQPWVEYGVEVFAWVTEWLPWPIGLLAPQADIIYSGWQPFAESVAFALAFLVDGQFDLVLPTLVSGVQTGISTFIQNEIAWIASFFPPLPPIGVAAAAPVAAGVGAAAATRAPALTRDAAEAVVETTATTTPITTATPETDIESVAAQADTAETGEVSTQAGAESVPGAVVAADGEPSAEVTTEALAEATTEASAEATTPAPGEATTPASVEVTAAESTVADVAPEPRAVRHSGRTPTQTSAATSSREAPAASAAAEAPAASSASDSAEPKSRVSARGGRAG